MVRVHDQHDDGSRSAHACPRCGAHRLALLEFPSITALPYQPHSELIGMGEPRAAGMPGIGCLACGAEWPSLAELEAEGADAPPDARATSDRSGSG